MNNGRTSAQCKKHSDLCLIQYVTILEYLRKFRKLEKKQTTICNAD